MFYCLNDRYIGNKKVALFGFYLKQGLLNAKKNFILILILALSLALIPTMGFLANGFFQGMFENEDALTEDGTIVVQNVDWDDNIDLNYHKSKIEAAFEGTKMVVQDLIPQVDVYLSEGFFYSNSSIPSNEILNSDSFANVSENFGRVSPRIYLKDKNFYDDFPSYQILLSGEFPKSQNDILISYTLAQKFNISVGMLFNVTFRINQDFYNMMRIDPENPTPENDFFEVNFANMTVCGIYLRSTPDYDSDYEYTYEDYVQNEIYDTSNLSYWDYSFYDSLYSFYNYSLTREENSHPYLNLINQMSTLALFNASSPDFEFSINSYVDINLRFSLKAENYKFNILNLRKEQQKYTEFRETINENLGSDYRFHSDYDYIFEELQIIFLVIRVAINVINLPILIFIISLGILSARVVRKTRINDFLLLRIKGLSKKMVRRQCTFEALVNGLIAFVLSFGFGLILFYVLRKQGLSIVSNILDIGAEDLIGVSQIHPLLTASDIFNTLFFSLICSLIMYIPIYYYNRKLSFSDLIAVKDAKDLPVVYDEVSVYDKDTDQVSLNWSEFLQIDEYEVNNETESDTVATPDEDATKKKRKRRKRKKTTRIYEDIIKEHEKKIPKIALITIIVAFIPILLNYLFLYSLNNNPPDILLDFLHFIQRIQALMFVLAIISPILIVSSLIRYIAIEKPSRFAKITKFLAKPFVGNFNRLFGLKMISSKELIKWIRIFAVFSTIFISFNMIMESTQKYEVITNNAVIGADVKLQFDANRYPQGFDSNILSVAKPLMLNMTNEENQTYINSIVDSKAFMAYSDQYRYNDRLVLTVNLSEYLDVIQEDGKVLPNTEMVEKIQKLNEYQEQNPTIPGILVSPERYSYYDYGLQVGQIINISIIYTNFSTKENITGLIGKEFKIIDFIEFPPGLAYQRTTNIYDYYGNRYDNFGLMGNVSNLLPVNCSPYYNEYYQFLDLNLALAPNNTVIQESLEEIYGDMISEENIVFYNQNWQLNDEDTFSFVSIVRIVETLLYFLSAVLALTLGLLLSAIKKSDDRFYSLLYSRGYGRKGTIRILSGQIFILYFIGIVVGLLGGYLVPSFVMNSIQSSYEYSLNRYYNSRINYQLPIYWQPLKVLTTIGAILVLAIFVYGTANFLRKQKVNQSLQQF